MLLEHEHHQAWEAAVALVTAEPVSVPGTRRFLLDDARLPESAPMACQCRLRNAVVRTATCKPGIPGDGIACRASSAGRRPNRNPAGDPTYLPVDISRHKGTLRLTFSLVRGLHDG